MGDCAELSVASNGCCFPAMSVCPGSRRSNDEKYYFTTTSTPPPPPAAAGSWELAGDHWCGTTHPGQEGFTQETGQGLAEQYGGDWAYSSKANNGWRYCGLSLEQCQAACLAMGDCAELSVASNGCCFPATSTCHGYRRLSDQKYMYCECGVREPNSNTRRMRSRLPLFGTMKRVPYNSENAIAQAGCLCV